MTTALIDFETQSEADLREVGGRNYAQHPSTRILCLCASIDRELIVWIPRHGNSWPRVPVIWPEGFGEERNFAVLYQDACPDALLACDTLVAHNCDEFDRWIWEEKVSGKPVAWVDTIHRARAAGLRGSLDELGKKFLRVGKSKVGERILHKMMTLPNGNYQPGNVGAVASYNIGDVLILERLWEVLPEVHDPVLPIHQRINSRGILFDRTLAKHIIAAGEEEARKASDEIERLTGITKLRSHVQMSAWLKTHGVVLPNIRQETVERFLNNPEEFSDSEIPKDVVHVLNLRKAATRITGGKLDNALASCSADGRLRDSFVYHGAHTGRWTGRRVQLQNLPRGFPGVDCRGLIEGQRDFASESARLGCRADQVLSTMIRPCFRASEDQSLLISDFAQVECRCVAWLAGEDRLTEAFKSGQDIYCQMASKIFSRTVLSSDKPRRFIGKETVLGSGYGMGATKFLNYLKLKGADGFLGETTAEECIKSFRDTYKQVVGLWYEADSAFKWAVMSNGESSFAAGRVRVSYSDSTLGVTLPSGRVLSYRRARVEDRVPPWGGDTIKQVIYESPRGESALFGGKIVENISQAICRDLIAEAMVRCEEKNLNVVAHVHDEIVCEDERAERIHELVDVMASVPPWAEGFPIGVEGFSCPRYVKEPWADSIRSKK